MAAGATARESNSRAEPAARSTLPASSRRHLTGAWRAAAAAPSLSPSTHALLHHTPTASRVSSTNSSSRRRRHRARIRSAAPRPCLITTSWAKTPRLAMTMSSKKPSALAGARAASRRTAGASAALRARAAPPTAPLAAWLLQRHAVTGRPRGVTRRGLGQPPSGGTAVTLSFTASRGRDGDGAQTARTPRSERRRKQWEQHITSAGLRSSTPGASPRESRRGLLMMRRRERALLIPGKVEQPPMEVPPPRPKAVQAALNDFGFSMAEIARRPAPAKTK